jgi:hypothetical protein
VYCSFKFSKQNFFGISLLFYPRYVPYSQVSLFDFLITIMSGEEYKSWRYLHPPVTFLLLGPSILLACKAVALWKFWVFGSNVTENSALLGYELASPGKWFLMCSSSVSPYTSRGQDPLRSGPPFLEDDGVTFLSSNRSHWTQMMQDHIPDNHNCNCQAHCIAVPCEQCISYYLVCLCFRL